MKKNAYVVLAMLALIGVILAACTQEAANDPAPQPEPAPIETVAPESAEEADDLSELEGNDLSDEVPEPESATTFTIEQIQAALQPQFQVGDWGEGNPQVISAEWVERDIDSFYWESAGSYVDLSNSVRYRVAVRFRQSMEDYTAWSNIWVDFEPNPFSRDGDYTILTEYYYFHDVNGTPELVIVMC